MALRNSVPLVFKGKGLSDTLDGSNVFPGAMASLKDLIPDPTTDDLWVCRPAAIVLSSSLGDPWSSGFSSGFGPLVSASNGFITAQLVVGTRLYGMVTTTAFGGGDAPFCFETTSNTFIPISGVAVGNIPASLASTGDWIPPTMTLVGTKIIVCHQGFVAPKFFGVIDTTNPNALAWSSGNLTGAISFTSPPYACGQFNQRAYYLVNPPGGQPSAVFSDVLVPTNATNANQVLTFGDNILLTAVAGLPLANQLGGVIQALIVFKDGSNLYQITGDAVGSTLAVNALNTATGTKAPNSITTTPKGLAFVAPDGLRLIDFNARVSDPIGLSGAGVNVPFINALTPSRMVAAYNANVLRISLQNGLALGSPNQEYWFDFARQRWSGPHSLPFAQISPIKNTFIGQPVGVFGQIAQSDVLQSSTSTFVENGVQLAFSWQTSMLPDTDQMAENSMVETTLFMSLAPGGSYTVAAVNENQAVFDSVLVQSSGAPTIWGQFQWGQAVWGGAQLGIAPQRMAWHFPIVFRRLAILAQGNSAGGVRIGNLHLKYEKLGYLQQTASGA